jgi:hypothetical protein
MLKLNYEIMFAKMHVNVKVKTKIVSFAKVNFNFDIIIFVNVKDLSAAKEKKTKITLVPTFVEESQLTILAWNQQREPKWSSNSYCRSNWDLAECAGDMRRRPSPSALLPPSQPSPRVYRVVWKTRIWLINL